MIYTIKPGIACYVMVYCDAFPRVFGERRQDYIYMDSSKPIEQSPTGTLPFESLPRRVRDTIHQHFKVLFDMPVILRQEYIKNLRCITVDVVMTKGTQPGCTEYTPA